MTGSLVAGVLTGLIYGLLGIGLVLVFKAARFVNLAHAQLGVLGALFVAKFVVDFGWSYWLAFPVGVGTGVVVGWLAEFVIIRRLRVASSLSSLLLTLGLAQILLSFTYVKALSPNPTQLYGRGYPVPFHTSWEIGGFVLGGQHVMTLLLVPAIGLGLAAFLAWTRLGLSIRALASNPDEARLCGIAPGRLRAMVWAIAGGLSAVTAILQAPGQASFNLAALGPGLLLRALGAAAIGGFASLSLAMVGGLGLGVVEHVALHVSGNGGVAELWVFAAIVLALLLRSRSRRIPGFSEDHLVLDARPARLGPSVDPQPRTRYERLWVGLAGLAVSLSLPFWPVFQPESKRFLLALMAVFALLAISLTVLLGWAGQVSLGHFAMLGIGAYMTARLEPHGWSMPMLLVGSGVVGATVMVAVGWPAVRLRGLTLAVTTLGFAVLAPQWLYVQDWFGSRGPVTATPPGIAGLGRPTSQLTVYFVSVAVVAAVAACLAALRGSAPGRLVVATRDNETATASLGFAPARVKIAVLAISGAVAAAAGVLWVSAWHTVSPELLAPESSFVILAAPVIGGLGSVGGAVLGTVVVYGPQFFLGSGLHSIFGNSIGMTLLISGLGLVAVQLRFPGGLAPAGRSAWERFARRERAGTREAP